MLQVNTYNSTQCINVISVSVNAEGLDYLTSSLPNSTTFILGGDTVFCTEVPIVDDNLYEEDEIFGVQALRTDGTAIVGITISDNEGEP